MTRRIFSIFSAVFLSLLIGAAPQAACAQETDDELPDNLGAYGRVGDFVVNGTSYHVFTRPGEATVQVMVVGAASGIYEVEVGTNLGELLALTGASLSTSAGPGTRRVVTVRLYRPQDDSRRALIYEEEIEDVLVTPGDYPTLQDEDVLTVEINQKRVLSWTTILSVIGSVAGLLLVFDRLFGFLPGRR